MCAQLGVARSSFYAWRARAGQVTATQARREALKMEVERVFHKQRGTAGCRRIAAILNDEGHPASVGLVADLMRELGLAAIQRKAYKRTTVPDEKAQVFADKLGRDFAPSSHRPGTALVGDITYLRTGQGWLYLATVIDLATRKVIGWQTAEHMRASLVVDALEMARTQGQAAEGAIFHSDHGSQYTSDEFVTYCTQHGFVQSMGRTGVLGQRRGGDVLRHPEKRDVPPAGVPYPRPSTVRRRRVHRGVLQPSKTALQPGLPHPGPGMGRRPQSRRRGPNRGGLTHPKSPRTCPQSLTQPIWR